MMRNESLLIALEKVRQGFAAAQALLYRQNGSVDAQPSRLNDSEQNPPAEDSVAHAASQLSVAIQQLEVIEQLEAEKVAEQAAKLTANKNLVEAILNNSPDGMLLAYIDSGIQQTNATFNSLFGCQEQAYFGQPLTTLVCDDYKDLVAAALQSVLSAQQGKTIEVRSCRFDGTVFDAEMGIGFLGADDKKEIGFVCTIRDITGRKAQERQLRYYASLQENVTEAVVSTDMNFSIQSWNGAAERIYGWTAEEVLGQNSGRLFKTQFGPGHTLESFQHELLTKGKWQSEVVQVRKDGTEVHIRSSINVFKDDNGHPLGVVGINHDITERKERERQLRYYASLQENVTEAVVSTDMNFSIQSWNRAAERIYGWTAEEAIGRNSHELFKTRFAPGETFEGVQHALITIGKYQSEVVQVRKDGSEVQILSSVTIFKDDNGHPLGVVGINHDITESKERERQLRFNASLQENVTEAVIATDLDFNIQSWNGAAERIYGWTAEEVLGKSAAILQTEFASGEPAERVAQGFLQKGYWSDEVTQHHKDGRAIYILSSVVLFKDGNGNPLGIVSVNHDISTRKQADEDLKVKIENELEFQIYLKALHEISIELTQIDQLNDFYRRVVESGLESLGFDRLALFLYDKETQEALGTYGTNSEGVVTDERHIHWTPGEEGVMARAFQRAERFCFDLDTKLHNALIPIGTGWNAAAALWDGTKSIGWLVADNFIHQQPASKALLDTLALYAMTVGTLLRRKQTEAALRESEARYRLLAENIHDVIIRLNPVGELLYVSPSSVAMLGYSPEEMVGRFGLDFVNADDITAMMFLMTHALDGTVPNTPVAFRFRHKQGHLIWLEGTGQVITAGDSNELVEFIASLRDISERKHAEEAVKQALEKEKELGELKSRFVSMTSHEFRTPLANIMAITETLSTYRQKMTDQQIEQRLGNIRGQVDHLKDIINDVLQVTRIDLQRVEYNPQLIDLDALCKTIISEFESLPGVPQQLIYTAENVPPELNLDKKLMRQIITNLVSNAIKYSPVNKSIRMSLACKENKCFLIVADQGIGIPEADFKHIFEPFHRATNVGTISGTGLGLIISRKAVELHGGTIAIQSKVGIGTTITIEIPLHTQKEN